MGGPNVGRFDSGLSGARNPIQEGLIEDQLMDALKVPVQAGDHTGAKKRLDNVRELLKKLSPQQAGELLDQLSEKHPKDPLAKEIKHRFSDSLVKGLKEKLEMISGRWANKHLHDDESLRKGLQNSGSALKAETDAAGNKKRSSLDEIWKAYSKADKIHFALTGSADGVDEQAITEALSGLTKEETKQLKRIYEEKYGENLSKAIQKGFGDTGFASRALGIAISGVVD